MLAELRTREPVFHQWDEGFSRQAFDRLAAQDFREKGASGRRYGRGHVWSVLEERYATDPAGDDDLLHTSGFRLTELAPDTFLVTYTLRQGDRITRRATVWRRHAADWVALYHQGTAVSDAPDGE